MHPELRHRIPGHNLAPHGPFLLRGVVILLLWMATLSLWPIQKGDNPANAPHPRFCGNEHESAPNSDTTKTPRIRGIRQTMPWPQKDHLPPEALGDGEAYVYGQG